MPWPACRDVVVAARGGGDLRAAGAAAPRRVRRAARTCRVPGGEWAHGASGSTSLRVKGWTDGRRGESDELHASGDDMEEMSAVRTCARFKPMKADVRADRGTDAAANDDECVRGWTAVDATALQCGTPSMDKCTSQHRRWKPGCLWVSALDSCRHGCVYAATAACLSAGRCVHSRAPAGTSASSSRSGATTSRSPWSHTGQHVVPVRSEGQAG